MCSPKQLNKYAATTEEGLWRRRNNGLYNFILFFLLIKKEVRLERRTLITIEMIKLL